MTVIPAKPKNFAVLRVYAGSMALAGIGHGTASENRADLDLRRRECASP